MSGDAFDLGRVFGTVALVNLLGWLTPGPNMLAVAQASLARGTRAGVVTACGVAAGGLVWASLAMAGVGVAFEALPALFLALKALGGAYLVWLGVRTWRRAAPFPLGEVRHAPDVARRSFRTGFVVNLTNPKSVLFHGAVLAAVVPVGAPAWLLAAIVVFTQTQSVIQHAASAVLFGTGGARRVAALLGRGADRLFGALFAGLGAGLLWQAARPG